MARLAWLVQQQQLLLQSHFRIRKSKIPGTEKQTPSTFTANFSSNSHQNYYKGVVLQMRDSYNWCHLSVDSLHLSVFIRREIKRVGFHCCMCLYYLVHCYDVYICKRYSTSKHVRPVVTKINFSIGLNFSINNRYFRYSFFSLIFTW